MTYVELRIALGSGLEGVLAGLPVVLRGDARIGGVPSAGELGGAEARGGAEGGASDNARHGGRNWDGAVEGRGGGRWWAVVVCDVGEACSSGPTAAGQGCVCKQELTARALGRARLASHRVLRPASRNHAHQRRGLPAPLYCTCSSS